MARALVLWIFGFCLFCPILSGVITRTSDSLPNAVMPSAAPEPESLHAARSSRPDHQCFAETDYFGALPESAQFCKRALATFLRAIGQAATKSTTPTVYFQHVHRGRGTTKPEMRSGPCSIILAPIERNEEDMPIPKPKAQMPAGDFAVPIEPLERALWSLEKCFNMQQPGFARIALALSDTSAGLSNIEAEMSEIGYGVWVVQRNSKADNAFRDMSKSKPKQGK